MNNVRSMNDQVMAVPFSEKGVIVGESPTGIRFVGNYDALVFTKALADGPENIKAGDVLFVKGTGVKQQWAKSIYDLGDGTKFILIPKSEVLLVKVGA